ADALVVISGTSPYVSGSIDLGLMQQLQAYTDPLPDILAEEILRRKQLPGPYHWRVQVRLGDYEGSKTFKAYLVENDPTIGLDE
ncbi:hypothetical protein LTR16_004653, partial [Cryomyces antarcticus]